jgi:hypothetical protein
VVGEAAKPDELGGAVLAGASLVLLMVARLQLGAAFSQLGAAFSVKAKAKTLVTMRRAPVRHDR